MDMAAVSERYTFEEMARQGLHATVDFFLLCQQSRNIEPLYRALTDTVRHDRAFADLHDKSVMRIESIERSRETKTSLELV